MTFALNVFRILSYLLNLLYLFKYKITSRIITLSLSLSLAFFSFQTFCRSTLYAYELRATIELLKLHENCKYRFLLITLFVSFNIPRYLISFVLFAI